MATLDSTRQSLALPPLIAILFANGIVTIAAVTISSIYLPISVTFDEEITGLGILSSLFFLGYGIIEAAGGAWTQRVGPKRVALAGTSIVAVSVLGTALSPSFGLLAVLRFIVGFGVGLSVPSIVVIAMRAVGHGRSGIAVGLVSVSTCIGSGLGIAGWSILAQLYGWRASLVIDAIITAIVAAGLYFMVPRDEPFTGTLLSFRGVGRMLADKRLQVISLSLFGSGVTGVLTGSFTVYYLEKAFDLEPGYAGSLTGVAYLGPIFTTVLAGRLYDKGVSGRRLIFGATALLGLGTALLAVHSLYVVLLGVILCGVVGPPIGTVTFAAAKKRAPAPDLEAMVIGIVDTFALIGVFTGAFIFPFMVLGLGYPTAWVLGGIIGVVLTAPVLYFRDL